MRAARRERGPALELAEQLEALAMAQRRQVLLRWGLRALGAGLLIDATLLLAARQIGSAVPAVPLAIAPVLLMASALVGALFHRPGELALARRADRALHLQERLTTAVELRRRGSDHPLAARQLADTLQHIRRHRATHAFPLLAISRRELAALAVSLAAALALLALPLGGEPRSGASAPAREAIQEEAERIAALAQEMDGKGQPVDPASQAAAVETLRETGQTLREETGSPERALAALADAERKLAALHDERADDLRQALAAAAAALQSDTATRGAAARLAQGDATGAAGELAELGQRTAELGDEQRASAAQALRSAASGAGRFDPKLGQRLADAADALAAGDAQAQAELAGAADALKQAAEQAATQDLVERALAQVDRSRAAIGDATLAERGTTSGGRGRTTEQAARGAEGSSGQAEEQSPAAGSTSGAGRPGEGGEQPADGQGQEGGQGSPTAGEGTLARSTDRFDAESLRSRLEQMAADDFADPSFSASDRRSLPDRGESRRELRDVYAEYRERATAVMQDRYIPLELKGLVEDYFTALNPGE